MEAEKTKHLITGQQVLVARQPIYTNRMEIFGYEFLFRSPDGSSNALNPTEATAQVLESIILDFGFDKFTHKHKAVINVTRAFIEVITEIRLPPKQIILDIPRSIDVDAKLIARLEELRGIGYGLSVKGSTNLKNMELLALASIFQFDVQHTKAGVLDSLIKRLRCYKDLALQATKIENWDEYRIYRNKGFDYLQGYFLGKPDTYVSGDISADKLVKF